MSDTLTDAAPVDTTAATPVGEAAPAGGSEVDAGSGDGRYVPVERFNGLMSSFNKAQTQVSDLERQLSELRIALDTKPEQETQSVPDNDVRSEIQELKEMLLEERMKSTRLTVLDEFPEVKPFADLIVADTEDDLRQMAKLLSERLKGASPVPPQSDVPTEEPVDTTPPVSETETVEPPVVGGTTTYDGSAAVESKVTDAIRNRSFKDFLAAKWEQMDSSLEQDA